MIQKETDRCFTSFDRPRCKITIKRTCGPTLQKCYSRIIKITLTHIHNKSELYVWSLPILRFS